MHILKIKKETGNSDNEHQLFLIIRLFIIVCRLALPSSILPGINAPRACLPCSHISSKSIKSPFNIQILCSTQVAIKYSGIFSRITIGRQFKMLLYRPFHKPNVLSIAILAEDKQTLKFFCLPVKCPLSLKCTIIWGWIGRISNNMRIIRKIYLWTLNILVDRRKPKNTCIVN